VQETGDRSAAQSAPSVAVDLHCHVLPRLDDGARDLDDAVGMGQQAEADGIEAICATPHIRHDHDVRIAELPERRAELEAALRTRGCPVRILPGGEVATTAVGGLDDRELEAVSLGGSGRWILLEPAPGPLAETTEAAVLELASRGFRAVLAHPERHAGRDVVSWLRRSVEAGTLVQATAASFVDRRTRAGMVELARAGVIHVLASDSHSSRAGRPVRVSSALEVLRTMTPCCAHLEWIARTAPLAVVRGQDTSPPWIHRAA
jgi:protein-tyrosine phosphatase